MNYTIYQIKNTHESIYSFMGYKFAKEHGFDFKDYQKTYSGSIAEKDGNILEQIFYELNTNHPSNYKGHSLFVSDIIKFPNGDTYYIDSVGFKYLGTGVIK